ncbi:Mitogen-activated protein kinase kinase kinase [Sesamum angolense]|uniref:Mitogen-activated protein kinase kinase kinase n=1 Tax=Sesamum angolense TaxID=2727404 RepID=A0AAE1W5T3_9LAMI|nr:Mitogen-activated protein kinase kinase kinase [Sesamum angolense]
MDPSSSSSSSRQGAKAKRLDRRNAAKNINYEFSPSTSASSSSYSSEESLRTRSLDLYGGRTSFRIDGSDGEFEIICNTLGFSGIDDFAIPLEEYEAMKVRSASAPVEFSQKLEPILYQKSEDDCDDVVKCSGASASNGVVDVMNPEIKGFDNSSHVDNKKFEDSPDFGYRDRSRVDVLGTGVNELSKRLGDSVRVGEVILSDKVSGKSSEFRGNGIKGVRPPVLMAPSLMALPVADKESSSLNASRGFALGTDTCLSRFARGFYLDEDGDRTEEGGQNRSEHEEGTRRRVLMREENCVLLDSCFLPQVRMMMILQVPQQNRYRVFHLMGNIDTLLRIGRRVTFWVVDHLDLCMKELLSGLNDIIVQIDGFFFAVKEVSLLDQGDEGKQRIVQLEQEIALLSQFQHENIVRYYGTNKDESHLYIFLELVTKGSLLSLYQKYELRVPQVSAYTRQILHGLKYLHDRGVIHRDIKCANILVHTNGLVKLADFGLAKATKLNDVNSCKGTAFWMAPEVVRSQWYGPAADIWSLGCTVLEMLTRRFPYSHLECVRPMGLQYNTLGIGLNASYNCTNHVPGCYRPNVVLDIFHCQNIWQRNPDMRTDTNIGKL